MNNYSVYWYKRSTHTDPYKQGYVGITNNVNRRDKEHRRSKKATHFTNALAKYSDISMVILHSNLSKENAANVEYMYRPTTNIAWNTAAGGESPLKSVKTRTVSLYHKDFYTKLHTFPSIEEASTALGISSSRIRQAIKRKSTNYGYDGWAVLLNKTHDRTTTLTIAQLRSVLLQGTTKSKPSVFKGNTNRWSKEQKQAISKVHKGKTISEQHKKAVSEKNKVNQTLCKPVTLVHISDLTKSYTYHSISEAARQLNIPLSRLKSKAQRPLCKHGNDGWAITHLGSE